MPAEGIILKLEGYTGIVDALRYSKRGILHSTERACGKTADWLRDRAREYCSVVDSHSLRWMRRYAKRRGAGPYSTRWPEPRIHRYGRWPWFSVHRRTGDLARSIQSFTYRESGLVSPLGRDRIAWGIRLVEPPRYWKYVFFGTRKMHARPVLEETVEKHRHELWGKFRTHAMGTYKEFERSIEEMRARHAILRRYAVSGGLP